MNISLDTEAVARIQLIEKLTHARIKDVVDEEDRLTVVVSAQGLRKALGKDAANIKKLESKFNKKVRMVEFDDDPTKFLRNLCKPNKIQDITQEEKTFIIIPHDYKSRGFIIGRAASTLRKNEEIMRRYFSVDEIKVEQANDQTM